MSCSAAPTPRPLWMWLRLAALGSLAPATWAVAHLDGLPKFPPCLFHYLTGLPCPGCGMTRSMLALARGDLVRSLKMHPLGVALAGLAAAAFLATAAGLVRGDDPARTFLERHGMRLVATLIAAFVALWVLRAFVVPSWAPDAVGG